MIIIIADVDEVAALLGLSTEQHPTIVRPQTSGPCVHCEDGTPYRCTYPYDDGRCPHLDNPAILCPVKDACAAMHEVARMREACEAEQEEQDADMEAGAVQQAPSPEVDTVWSEIRSRYPLPAPHDDPSRLHTYAIEPEEEPVYETRKGAPLANMWTPAECAAIASAGTRQEALAGYRAAFPDSDRTDGAVMRQWYAVRSAPVTATDGRRGTWTPEEDRLLLNAETLVAAAKLYRAKFGDKRTYAAISSRFYRVRKNPVEPTPDFAGDTVPVTQIAHDLSAPLAAGDFVVLEGEPGYIGEILRIDAGYAEVQWPDGAVPGRQALDDLWRI